MLHIFGRKKTAVGQKRCLILGGNLSELLNKEAQIQKIMKIFTTRSRGSQVRLHLFGGSINLVWGKKQNILGFQQKCGQNM